jgi:hypothetical protein
VPSIARAIVLALGIGLGRLRFDRLPLILLVVPI